MLTRLEVNGFKNLVDFAVDFGPFTCIAGPNGAGKSNIFDVIRFLSLLTEHTLTEAALRIRDSDPDTTDLKELFWHDGSKRTREFSLAAEMILEPAVTDDFGRPAMASSTYLRYELRIGHETELQAAGSFERLVLRHESLSYFTESEAGKKLRFPHSAKCFRASAIRNTRRTKKKMYISTEQVEDHREILVHQEGQQGRPQRAAAASAPRTIVGTSNTSSTPTILAARREMQNWRILALEPTAMRRPDKLHATPYITHTGGHLPATLYRLASDPAGNHQDDASEAYRSRVYASIANRLAELVPVESVRIDLDTTRKLLTLFLRERSGAELPARALSDGTLRFLVLCALGSDPDTRGLICMEEPENGIHPGKMAAILDLLKEIAVDPEQFVDADNPLRQVIVATHSTVFVQCQDKNDLIFAARIKKKTCNGNMTSTLKCLPLKLTWRSESTDSDHIGMATLIDYLQAPENAPLQHKLECDLS